MTVTQMRDGNGQQYFHITFTAQNVDTSVTYYVVRWRGVAPDTTNRETAGYTYPSNQNGEYSYNDYGGSETFNPTHTSSGGYTWTYSYAAYGVRYVSNSSDSVLRGDMNTPVSGTLDSVYLYFSNVPGSDSTVHIGDTVTWTFAVQSNVAQIDTPIKYTASSYNPYVAQVAIEQNGNFSAVVLGYGSTEITVKGTDAAGRSALYSFTISVETMLDTITVTLRDASTNGLLPSGTEYFYSLNSPTGSNDTLHRDSVYLESWDTINSSGTFTLVFPKLPEYLRVGAEGYNAAWATNNAGDSINVSTNGSSYTIDLSAAATHTISGTVTDISNNNPISGATIELWRVTRHYDAYKIHSTTTDANGNYQLTVSAGDAILGTEDVDVKANATGYNNGSGSSGSLSSLEDHSNVNFQFSDKTGGAYLSCLIETPLGNAIRTFTTVTAYLLRDSSSIAIATGTDSTNSGWSSFYLSPGRYVLFAQTDTGYQSGYYSANGYAATWTQADTITIPNNSNSWDTIIIVLQPDSSIAQQGKNNNGKIDGIVYDQSGNIASDAHLLLYQQINGAAGGNTSHLLYTTTTASDGSYSFGRVPVGQYIVVVDIVGKAIFESGLITIGGENDSVSHNITYGTEAVNEGAHALPSQLYLAQNYPNPFSRTSDIMFSIPYANANVRLMVYNSMGKAMRTMAAGRYQQGNYSVRLD
ncbi:MAG TPA: carboxypeptidase-like regulatory domain-containing protein, partial [Candidatus Kapabacteria bacterium]|nr:carboxypeptidase-like regulatory domain-containing protein [Candidatus Kapabacteria bacterium]